MGHSTSKEPKTPNNPWEAEIDRKKRREQHAKERAAELKQLEKQRKRSEKEAKRAQRKNNKKKRKSKLDLLKDTEPPPIVRKSKAQLEESDYDSEAIRRMKDQLAFNSDIFVLNQLLLGVQFCGNFESSAGKEAEDECRVCAHVLISKTEDARYQFRLFDDNVFYKMFSRVLQKRTNGAGVQFKHSMADKCQQQQKGFSVKV